jgi:hypothetical protein
MLDEGERRLFRHVLALALQEDDALDWLASRDGMLVCAIADVDPDFASRAVKARRVRD